MTEYNINSQFTLLERAKRSADGRSILPVLEVMDKFGVEDFLKDVPFFPCNQGLKHRIIRNTSRPGATRRAFYAGVGSSMMTTQVIFENVILFEARREIDEDELNTIENPDEIRRTEDEAKITGIIEDVVKAIFTDARTSGSLYFDGFVARSGTLSYPGHSTTSLPYVWNNGGSSNLCSVWVVEFGPKACFGLYPSGNAVRGARLGILAKNKGLEPKADTSDTTLTYYIDVAQFKMWAGLGIADDRKFFRVANISRDKANAYALNEDILIEALNHAHINRGAARMYVNPYVATQIDIRAKDKVNVNWSVAEVFGRPIRTFLGMPIRVLDDTILTATESAIA